MSELPESLAITRSYYVRTLWLKFSGEGYQQGAVWPGGKTGNRRKQCKSLQAHRASAQPPENHWDGQIELETPPDGVRRSHEKCPNARSLLRSGAVYLVWSLI